MRHYQKTNNLVVQKVKAMKIVLVMFLAVNISFAQDATNVWKTLGKITFKKSMTRYLDLR